MNLQWTVSSCILIFVVLLLRGLLGNRISTGLRYALWGIVLVRLLVPVQLFTIPAGRIDVMDVSVPVPEQWREESIYVLPVLSMPAEAAPVEFREDGTVLADANFFGYPRLEDNGATVVRYAHKLSPAEVSRTVWAAGCIIISAVMLLSNLHFAAKLRRIRRPLKGNGCKIPVYLADGLPSPCLFGVFKPAVYVTPDTADDPAMLRHVLAHETTHYRHLDHIWSVLRSAALAVHWWNPLVWLSVILSRRDGELACDAGALKLLGREERVPYGETLLSLVTAKPSPRDLLSCATTMSGETRSLRERIRRISCEPKQLAGAAAAVVLIAFAASACSFSKTEAGPQQPEEQALTGATGILSTDGGYSGSRPVLSGNRKEGFYTFLLVGNDMNGNNDTIMILSYDTVNQDMSVMSVPRDTAVYDSQGINRIAYISNIAVLKESVRSLVGFTPDYYVKINPGIVVQLIDLLGGVEFEVPQNMDYDDSYQELFIHLEKGVQTLNGEQAMGLLRFRRYSGGDIARADVQQSFIKAVIEKCLSLKNLDKIQEYIDLAAENVETDLSFDTALWFAANMLGLNNQTPALGDVYTCTMPGDYFQILYWNHTRLSVAASYPEQVLELVNDRFNPYKSEITVSMLNAVTASALEQENAQSAEQRSVTEPLPDCDTYTVDGLAVKIPKEWFDVSQRVGYGVEALCRQDPRARAAVYQLSLTAQEIRENPTRVFGDAISAAEDIETDSRWTAAFTFSGSTDQYDYKQDVFLLDREAGCIAVICRCPSDSAPEICKMISSVCGIFSKSNGIQAS
ncbi:MAG: LCP family protein [Oscillospiraceae bacterium]|nr:LCP family protein [Oscillospiraceae bacterium]